MGAAKSRARQQIFHDLSYVVVVPATADINIAYAQSTAEILGADHAFIDYQDLFPFVASVLVVTPHNLHREMGVRSLQAGKHVLMEKPMAISEPECLDLIDTATRSSKTLMTAYPMHYQPLVVKLKELIDAEYLGKVFHIGIFTEQLTEPLLGHWMRSAKHLGGGQFFSHGWSKREQVMPLYL